jgi:hypothetical protein
MSDVRGTESSASEPISWRAASIDISNTAEATYTDPVTGADGQSSSNTVNIPFNARADFGTSTPGAGTDNDNKVTLSTDSLNLGASTGLMAGTVEISFGEAKLATVDPQSAPVGNDPLPRSGLDVFPAPPVAIGKGGAAGGLDLGLNPPVINMSDIQSSADITGAANAAANTALKVATSRLPLGLDLIAGSVASGVGARPPSASADANNVATTAPASGPVPASMLSRQTVLDAAAMGVRATDLDAKDAIAFKNAGVDMTEIGTTPTQMKDLNQMIAAGGARPIDSAADGASVLVASAKPLGGSPGADGTDIARLPGLGRFPQPIRSLNGPGLKPNDPKFPGAGLYAPDPLNSWSTNADVSRVVSNAVRDKGSNTALNKGSNVENATRDVLDNVSSATKFGLQLKTGFKPDALYPLGGAAQNAVIVKEENKSSTSLSSIRRIRDILAGRTPEPLTATEIMTQYDKGMLPKRQSDGETRVEAATKGEIDSTMGFYSGKSMSVVEAQRRVNGGPWVRDPTAIVRVTETKTTVDRPVADLRTRSGTLVRGEQQNHVEQFSTTKPGGTATVASLVLAQPPDRPEEYKPTNVKSEDLWRGTVDATRDIKIVTSGVAIFPSNIGNVYRKVDVFDNPPPLSPGVWSGANSGTKTLGTVTTENFTSPSGSHSFLRYGEGSWTIGPNVSDFRGKTSPSGPRPQIGGGS